MGKRHEAVAAGTVRLGQMVRTHHLADLAFQFDSQEPTRAPAAGEVAEEVGLFSRGEISHSACCPEVHNPKVYELEVSFCHLSIMAS